MISVFNWAVLGLWFIFLGYWLASARNAKKNVRGGTRRWLGWRIAAILVLFLLFQLPAFRAFVTYDPLASVRQTADAIGVILCAAGIALAIWARAYLGSNWGMPMSVKENPELVTSGPYRFVRHPIYTGVLLAILGSTLVAGMWWLIVFIFAAIYFISSAAAEEKLMMRTFPDAYPAYKARTKMLIPFVF